MTFFHWQLITQNWILSRLVAALNERPYINNGLPLSGWVCWKMVSHSLLEQVPEVRTSEKCLRLNERKYSLSISDPEAPTDSDNLADNLSHLPKVSIWIKKNQIYSFSSWNEIVKCIIFCKIRCGRDYALILLLHAAMDQIRTFVEKGMCREYALF